MNSPIAIAADSPRFNGCVSAIPEGVQRVLMSIEEVRSDKLERNSDTDVTLSQKRFSRSKDAPFISLLLLLQIACQCMLLEQQF